MGLRQEFLPTKDSKPQTDRDGTDGKEGGVGVDRGLLVKDNVSRWEESESALLPHSPLLCLLYMSDNIESILSILKVLLLGD